MKFHLLTLLCLLFMSTGCTEDAKLEEQKEEKKMDWNMVVGKAGFPARVKVLINDQELFDECLPSEIKYTVTRANVSTIYLPEFESVSAETKFKLTIHDKGSCYENGVFHESLEQKFEIRKSKEKESVWIEIF